LTQRVNEKGKDGVNESDETTDDEVVAAATRMASRRKVESGFLYVTARARGKEKRDDT
jgi:hypothetical protein